MLCFMSPVCTSIYLLYTVINPDRKEKELKRRIERKDMHRSESRVDANTYDKSDQLLESFGGCDHTNKIE
ncbi:hypothetical protein VNO78_05013 [Psophocarpus tetragonolobus]|uniref:Uncharacterized protein n=1 Tax=Psophocarpus tetragonolobus TaxID=3891 RepID=A0AAN9T066_PSOTE